MNVYLYALVSPGDALSDLARLTGVTPGPVQAADAGPYRLIYGAHDGSDILPARRRMLAHTRVLEALMARTTVLPMRFGIVADDLAEAQRLVAAQTAAIAPQMERLGGHVEVGLRVAWPREAALAELLRADPALATERDRLMGRGAEAHFDRIALGRRVAEALDRRRTAAQHALLPAVRASCADHVLRAPEEDVEALRVECLVAEDGQDRLAAAVAEAAARLDFAPAAEPTVRVIGPVPPFHFVDLALSGTAEAA